MRAALKPVASAALVVTCAVLFCAVFFWPGTFGGRSLASGDALLQGIPVLRAPALLWDPGFSMGHPLYADPNEAYFYPLAILSRLLQIPFNLYMIAPFGIALCGVFGLARRYTMSTAAAIVSALTFALGGFMISHAGHVNIDHPAAWSTVFFLALEEMRVRPAMRWPVVAGAIALALCFVSGQPQVAAFALAVAFFYCATFARTAPGGAISFVARWAATIAAGLGLAAVLLIPEMQLASLSFRNHLSETQMLYLAMPLEELPVRLLFGHVLDADVRGGFTELSNATGSLALLLAIVAVRAFWRDLRVRFWASIALGGIALSTGNALGLGHVTSHLPLYELFRIPGRHAYEFDFAVALLAGFGAADLLANRVSRRAIAIAIGVLAGLLAIAVGALAFLDTPALQYVRGAVPQVLDPRANPSLLVPAAFALGGTIVLAVVRMLPARAVGIVLAVTVLGDISSFAWYSYWNTESTAENPLPAPPLAVSIRARLGPGKCFVWLPGAKNSNGGLAPNLNRVWHVPSAAGYTSLDVASAARFTQMQLPEDNFDRISDAAFDLAGVQFVAAPKSDAVVTPASAPIVDATLSHFIGSPVSGAVTATDQLGLPRPERADAIALVTALGNSIAVPQGAIVARVSIRFFDGRTLEKPFRAGIESSESAYDRVDVRPLMKHARATVFPSNDGGHQYIATLRWGRAAMVRSVTIRWVWDARDRAAMTINGVAFIDHASGRAYPIPHGVQAALFTDPDHWKYEPFGAFDVFSNAHTLPPVWVAQRSIVEPDDAATLAMIHGGGPESETPFPYRTTALVPRPITAGPYSAGDRAYLRASGATARRFAVTCAAACLVVDSGTAYPGWVASIDGRPAPLEKVDAVFRGVLVPAGRHDVLLQFEPRVLIGGAVLSFASCVALLAYLFTGMRVRRTLAAVTVRT